MSKGYIYVVKTATNSYCQENFFNVPTEYKGKIFFGACKKGMRPKLKKGDFIFGVSPSKPKPRKILFAAKIEDKVTFAEAYKRFPFLRGPKGPIFVKPVNRPHESFPESNYEHIKGSTHKDVWMKDIKTPDLDCFLVCEKTNTWIGRWLGEHGPIIDDEIISFFKTCPIYGKAGKLSDYANDATEKNPISHKRLFAGLHLEIDDPLQLVKICEEKIQLTEITSNKKRLNKQHKAKATCYRKAKSIKSCC